MKKQTALFGGFLRGEMRHSVDEKGVTISGDYSDNIFGLKELLSAF
jgi:hypothetical protein